MTNLESAQKYFKQGFSIIPVGAGEESKVPLINGWKEFQTRKPTEQEITIWWTEFPNANIAILTGKISGITVIDFDVAKDENNQVILKNDKPVLTKHLYTPDTFSVKTAKGGYHYYYKYTDKLQTGTNVFKDAPHTGQLDIRNDGGYVLAPPSKNQFGEWEVFTDDPIIDVDLAKFQLIVETQGERKKTTELVGVKIGSRNDSLASLCGKLMRITPQAEWEFEVFPVLVQIAKTYEQGRDPMTESEIRSIYHSIGGLQIAQKKREDLEKLNGIFQNKEGETPDDEVVSIAEAAERLGAEKLECYPTDIPFFDESNLGGLYQADLGIISGKSGEGKTTFAQTITYNLHAQGIKTLWFSYEVLLSRLWEQFQKMGTKKDFLAFAPFKTTTGNVAWIKSKIQEAKAKYNTKVIFIDHLGFLLPEVDPKKFDANLQRNLSSYMGMICRQLKNIAKEEKVAIVLMWHVNRGMGKETTDENLKDSSEIKNESDWTLIIQRMKSDANVGPRSITAMPTTKQEIYTNFAAIKQFKNRRTGICSMRAMILDSAKGRFVEYTESSKNIPEIFKQLSEDFDN